MAQFLVTLVADRAEEAVVVRWALTRLEPSWSDRLVATTLMDWDYLPKSR
ncbi:MAG: hypothetical protein ABL898_01195 [Hyphomicrobiaceae bacterium]|nr:hypothetical protein [Hyphomicrobiaceae bacterium]